MDESISLEYAEKACLNWAQSSAGILATMELLGGRGPSSKSMSVIVGRGDFLPMVGVGVVVRLTMILGEADTFGELSVDFKLNCLAELGSFDLSFNDSVDGLATGKGRLALRRASLAM